MRLSVIVPAYNEEKYLGPCLQSIRQALQVHDARIGEYEIIVANNNSCDRTTEVARQHLAEVVFEPVNHISRARNAGARASRGQWLLFVDADCVIHPRTIADMLDHIDSGRYIGGGCDVRVDHAPPVGKLIVLAARKIMKLINCAGGSFVFCRADAFREVGGFSRDVYAGEEILFSKALKRWARPRRLKFIFLTAQPIITSGRKFDHYSYWDFAKVVLWSLISPRRTLGSRERLGYFYDARR